MATTTAQIYESVQSHYGSCARETPSSAKGGHSQRVAQAFGYTAEDLADAPDAANLGLSCGNPIALAGLKPGETVIDLGSGGGFDVFLAGKKVGEGGRAIGVDMNKEMLARAKKNRERSNAANTTFVESPITNIDLPPSTADCIISNCVINLVPETEKQLVFNEMFRLLKPGGRVAVSDILLKKPLTADMKQDIGLYVGCISGASEVSAYERYLREAGFDDVLIVDSKNNLNVYKGLGDDGQKTSCCGAKPSASCGDGRPADPSVLSAEHVDIDFNEWAGSYHVYAIKR